MNEASYSERVSAYEQAWLSVGVEIFREQIRKRGIIDTGRLHEDWHTSQFSSAGTDTLRITFMQYGLYMDAGVGYGYRMFNDHGDLKFLDKATRAARGLNRPRRRGPGWGGGYTSGKPREPRPWFHRKMYRSLLVMKEDLAQITGEAALAVISVPLSR